MSGAEAETPTGMKQQAHLVFRGEVQPEQIGYRLGGTLIPHERVGVYSKRDRILGLLPADEVIKGDGFLQVRFDDEYVTIDCAHIERCDIIPTDLPASINPGCVG